MYIGNFPGSSEFLRFQYTSTSGQTIFTGNDINNHSLNVFPGLELVYVNGSLRSRTTYSISETTLTFNTGLNINDSVLVIVFRPISLSNALSISGGNQMQASLNMGNNRITNVSPGSSGTDTPNLNQVVRIDATQSLNTTQRQTARNNIDAYSRLGGNLSGSMTLSNNNILVVGTGAIGNIQLIPGTSTVPGYINFNTSEGTRRGFIGFGDGNNNLLFMTENSWNYRFPQRPIFGTNGTPWDSENFTPANKQDKLKSSSGSGQLVSLNSGVGANLVLPAGGRWVAWWLSITNSTGAISGPPETTEANGGSIIKTGSVGIVYYGFAVRIE